MLCWVRLRSVRVLEINVENYLPRDARRPDDLRRFSSVVSWLSWARVRFIWNLVLASRRSVSQHRVVWRLEFEVGFASIGVGSITSCRMTSRSSSTKNAASCRRRDARRQFASVMKRGIPRLTYAIYELFQRWDDRRSDAQRRFASCGIPRLICAMDGILCWRRDAYRCGSRRGFASVTSSRGSGIVEYIRKIVPKLKIFTEGWTQNNFRVCNLSSCNLLVETNKFCLGAYT
jgi:hypothetical protein